MTDLTHDELLADLANSLRSGTRRSQRFVVTNANLGSRWLESNCPRADLFAMRKSYTQFEVAIYEVKANRADFSGDIARGKWRRYLPFCHRFYWAAPAGLIKLEDLEAEVGLIVRSNKGWQTVRKAAFRAEIEFDFDILLSVLFACGTEEGRVRDLRDRLNAARWATEGHEDRVRAKFFGQKIAELVHFARRGGAENIIRERDRYQRGFERVCRRIGLRKKRDQEDLLGEGKWTADCLDKALAAFVEDAD